LIADAAYASNDRLGIMLNISHFATDGRWWRWMAQRCWTTKIANEIQSGSR
jgi:hypothetical protein